MNGQLPVDSRMKWYRDAVTSDASEHAKVWARKNQQELLDMATLCSSGSSTEVMEMDKIASRESRRSGAFPIFKKAASDGTLGDYKKGFSDDLKFLWRDIFSDEALWMVMCMIRVREEEVEPSEIIVDDSWDFGDSTSKFS